MAGCWQALAGRYERSVGELERAIQALEEQHRRLLLSPGVVHEQRLRAMGTFAAGVAHEINNPIQAIISFAQLLDRRLPADGAERGFAREIAAECRRIAQIVRSLQSFAGSTDDKIGPIEARTLIEDSLSLTGAALQDDGVEVSVEVDPDAPALSGQTQQLRLVLINLLSNARDAIRTRAGDRRFAGKIQIRVTSAPRDGHPWLRLQLTDNGAGIEDALRERVFEPFFTTKAELQATGLGLSIAHGIVTSHGGEFTCSSAPRSGVRRRARATAWER